MWDTELFLDSYSIVFHKSAYVCLATFPEELLRFQMSETLSAGLKVSESNL